MPAATDPNHSHVFQRKVSKKSLACVGTKNNGLELIIEDPVTKERKVCVDAVSGAAVCSLGHNDPEIIDHLSEYMRESAYTIGGSFGNYASENLSKYMCDLSNGLFSSCLWVGSGSEANENSIKIMRQYHLERGDSKRYKVISRRQGYHGFTIGALSLSDCYRKPLFAPILLTPEQSPKLEQCFPYRGMTPGMTEEEYTKVLLEDAERVFVENDPSTISGVIIETVGGGISGTVPPPKGYLDGLRDIAHKYGALFQLDEVMCGLGRCGTQFAFLHPGWGLSSGGPDLMSVGKTIASGYVTLAGVMVSPKVVDVYENGSDFILGTQTYHCHSFNCRVGLAVQQKIHRDNLIENVRVIGGKMKKELTEQLKDCKIIGEVRGAGSFLSMEIVKNKETKEAFPPELEMGDKIRDMCFDKGLIVLGLTGTISSKKVGINKMEMYGDHVTISPAFSFTEECADFTVKTLVEVFHEVEKKYL